VTAAKTTAKAAGRAFRVTLTHHPSHYVPDLAEAEHFFATVFGRPSIPINEVLKRVAHVRPGFPRDYSAYTPIADVFFDSLDPTRLTRLGGEQNVAEKVRHPVPHLGALGWYVEDQVEAYRTLRSHGYEIKNTIGEIQDGPIPTGPNDPAPFFTSWEQTGMRYEFYPAMVFPCDIRTELDWVLPPVSDDDPLGIERCSHHTLLTAEPERATGVLVNVLGGEILGQGRNETLGASSTYVRIGDATLEFATPDEGTPAYQDWAGDAPNDTYHAITWKVADLARAEAHLESHGVRISRRTGDGLVTDSSTSLGIPWGFTESLVPGDPRDTALNTHGSYTDGGEHR
jgi:catechol 2,3-dioxygenase-like lactoylglutathione lyase family enzyme